MKQTIITQEVELVLQTCIACGTPFGVEILLDTQNRRNGAAFYCPNGHRQGYSHPIEKQLEETRRKLTQAEEQAEWWKQEAEEKAKQLAATKGQLTKTKKRFVNGACPCCHRQFTNLQRHMTTKHPDYAHAPESEL